MKMNRTQPQRAIILLIYVFVLFVFNYLAFGTFFPEKDFKGLWFWAGIASILLGNLLVTPFYTKPVDAISYSVVSLISIFLVNNWINWELQDRIIFISATLLLSFILIISFISILTKDSIKISNQKLSKSCLVISDVLGNQRVVFSVVILFAILVFHRTQHKELFFITIAWITVVVIEPDQHILGIFNRIHNIWKTILIGNQLGKISAYQTPNLILISQPENTLTNFGTPIIYKDSHSSIKTGVTLNYVGLDENLLLRAMEFQTPSEIIAGVNDVEMLITTNSVIKFDYFESNPIEISKVPLLKKINELIGIVDELTNIENLQFEILKDEDLEEGRLIEVDINDKPVIYQILDGNTKEDIVYQKNKYGYAKGEAKKIGIWDKDQMKFIPTKWLPRINSPIYIKNQEDFTPEFDVIGHFPQTNYTIKLKSINTLVTHNTAILGILGIGKSMLAIELVERMIAEKIKVICIDLTNQYSNQLIDFYNLELETAKLERLYKIGASGKTKIVKNVEEGGSIKDINREVYADLKEFINGSDSMFLKIYNPAKFEVWRQDSKPYGDQASMATLTPTEITQMISECALGICQSNGMTDDARVCLVYEEAHSLIPEWNSVACDGDKSATNGTARAILQGRKYGLGCLLVTQRTANVTKTILNQCNTIFAMRTFDDTGKTFIANYIGSAYADKLSTLQERHAVFYGKASSCENPVLIRLNDREDFIRVFREKYPLQITSNSKKDIL
jgi:hypothetical protein